MLDIMEHKSNPGRYESRTTNPPSLDQSFTKMPEARLVNRSPTPFTVLVSLIYLPSQSQLPTPYSQSDSWLGQDMEEAADKDHLKQETTVHTSIAWHAVKSIGADCKETLPSTIPNPIPCLPYWMQIPHYYAMLWCLCPTRLQYKSYLYIFSTCVVNIISTTA